MIVTKLTGGLGNQMFQYAIGRGLSLKHNTMLHLDISYFENLEYTGILEHRKHNIFGLHNFNISESSYTLPYTKLLPIRERFFGFNSKVLEVPNDICLEGYWQDERYFKHIKTMLQFEFALNMDMDYKNQKMLNDIWNSNSVCIHIRGGDKKINNGKLHIMPDHRYYTHCLEDIFSKEENLKLFVFTDDTKYVVNQFFPNELDNVVIVDINNDTIEAHLDFNLMKACKHFIIAPSTFSWWAAWLQEKEGTRIYAPERWEIADNREWEKLVPDRWNKIPLSVYA